MLRLSRWALLLAVPLLAAAVLVMHGGDAGAAGAHAARGAGMHESQASPDHDDCASCTVGHLVAACVAVLATATVVVAARRGMLPLRAGAGSVSVPRRVRAWDVPVRPPGPAWVRLAVMRC